MFNSNELPATLLCDFYKVAHREQYPKGTETIYSTWIPRSNKYWPHAGEVVSFGFQSFIKEYLIDFFNEHFFNRPKWSIIAEYTRFIHHTLNTEVPSWKHIADLHDLGYLPIHIKALPEGIKCPIRVPMMTIYNTNTNFFWLTNYLETLISTELWQPATSATIANEYKILLDKYAEETASDPTFTMFQGHDFSMRGMAGLHSAMKSGAGHLLSFVGTDTIPAIMFMEKYYNADVEKELVGTSVPATEHSVMCAGGDTNEFDTYKRLITEIYPNGIVSIVSDTWDLWTCIEKIIYGLKNEIMARDGKVVIRPDSGNPVLIVCGDPDNDDPRARKGVIEMLWDIFGGIVNEKGYRELDSHIGAIYGDAITLERADEICKLLMEKGFASTNIIFGIGSYTYQYNTRDTFGFAVKSTMCVINGKEIMIFKDPKTDDGTKKSMKGVVAVVSDGNGSIKGIDGLTLKESKEMGDRDLLRSIFCDGELLVDESLATIKGRLANY